MQPVCDRMPVMLMPALTLRIGTFSAVTLSPKTSENLKKMN
jgi:hypothetical protein